MSVLLAGKNALRWAMQDASERMMTLLEHHKRCCLCVRKFQIHVLSWHNVVGDWRDLWSHIRKMQSLLVVYLGIYVENHRMVHTGWDLWRSLIQSPHHPDRPAQSRADFRVGSSCWGPCPVRFWILPRMPQLFSSLAVRLSIPSVSSDCFPACQTTYDNRSYSSEIKVIKLWDRSCCLNCRWLTV